MGYKIIDRAIMSDGTKIQLEDWRESNTAKYPDLYGYTIAAYPIVQRTSKYNWTQYSETFRLSIPTNNYSGYTADMVKADYEALKRGKKNLEDLAEHFQNGDKDAWLLGMDIKNNDY